MKLALSIKRGIDPDEFISLLVSKGIEFERIAGLPRHFVVKAPSGLAFARLVGTAYLNTITDAERKIAPADQTMTLGNRLEEGNWSLPRIIRRNAPWNVDRMKHPIDTFYRSLRDGTGVDIYWFDTGIRTTHDEFGGRASIVYEYVSHSGAGDTHGHGTRQAANAAGETLGPARGANVFSFSIETASGVGTSSNAALLAAIGAAATHYAGRSNPAVANCSFTPSFDSTVNDAISDLMDDGMVWCFSAGNSGVELTVGTFPSAFVADMIVSGGMEAADLPLNNTLSGALVLTNYGAEVDIMSPGSFIRSALISGDSACDLLAGGTSAASAMTCGVIACMLEGHSKLTSRADVQAVRAALLANATTGKFRNLGLTLPDKILYLNPDQTAPEPIEGI